MTLASIEELAQAYVQNEVLGYISDCEGACDTLDGIVDWWIVDQRRRIARQTISAAVDRLVRGGVLIEIQMADGDPLYFAPAAIQQEN